MIGPDDRDKQASFVICAMEFGKNAGICAQNLGLDLIKINTCTESEKGTKLQLEAEEYSKNVINKSGFVPTIVYNHYYKAGDFWASLDDFEGVINDQIAAL